MRWIIGIPLLLAACADDVAGGDTTSTDASSASAETSSSVGDTGSSSADGMTAESSSGVATDTSSSSEGTTGDAQSCDCGPDEICIEAASDACNDPHVPVTSCIPRPAACRTDDVVCGSACGWDICGGPGCAGFGAQVCGVASEGVVCSAPMLGCNLFAQDCPRGEKCTSWDNDADQLFNATRCSPVDVAPAPVGNPCTFEGSPYSGIDNCVVGAMCLLSDPEDDASGICRAACIGNPYDASCEDPQMTCAIEDDWFGWCVPA